MSIKTKITQRESFFNDFLKDFKTNSLEKYAIEQFGEKYRDKGIEIQIVEDASEAINHFYWDLVENHTRPTLKKAIPKSNVTENKSEQLDRVDIYKILSCTEFAIMRVSPLFLKVNGKLIDYDSDIQDQIDLAEHEDNLNGYLAFFCAFEFLRSFGKENIINDGINYSELFKNDKVLSYLKEKDKQKYRESAYDLLTEHIFVLMFTSKSPILPIISNSTWWRAITRIAMLLNRP